MGWWESKERWAGRTQWDVEVAVWLLQINDPFSKAWRVEWSHGGGHRKGLTFPTEQEARGELERQKEALGGDWRLLG